MVMDLPSITARVREVVEKAAGIRDATALSDTDDLWDAGMDSLASVNLMVQLEDAFGVQFPDELLTREVFSSIASIAAALAETHASVELN
jgi:acyl carrier protein